MKLLAPGLTDELKVFSGSMETIVRAAMETAYRQGFKDGSANMRDAILKASESVGPAEMKDDLPEPSKAQASDATPAKRKFNGRVLKGSIGEAIDQIFELRQGLTVQDLHALVRHQGIAASKEGVGVQLRRNEGSRYRRDGRMWFPLVTNETGTVDSGPQ